MERNSIVLGLEVRRNSESDGDACREPSDYVPMVHTFSHQTDRLVTLLDQVCSFLTLVRSFNIFPIIYFVPSDFEIRRLNNKKSKMNNCEAYDEKWTGKKNMMLALL